MYLPPVLNTIDPPISDPWGLLYLLRYPVLTPALSRVSSRPRNGIRKIDTRMSLGVHYNSISTNIPIRYIRAGVRSHENSLGFRN